MTVTELRKVKVEPSAKRVRTVFGGDVVADSTATLLVWERPYYPTYYFPAADVRRVVLVPTGETQRSSSRGDAVLHDVVVDDRSAPRAAAWFRESPIEALRDHVRFDWDAMDAWFEEDEEVYVHPRDPYTRIDVLQSSRLVRVEVDGTVMAESPLPRILFETGLPRRWYLPKIDVRLELLRPSQTQTRCPYKGTASYYDIVLESGTHKDLVWWYQHPTLEAAKIAGYVCFYNEKVDLTIDGVLQERPRSPFS